jgi:hypothetical protein
MVAAKQATLECAPTLGVETQESEGEDRKEAAHGARSVRWGAPAMGGVSRAPSPVAADLAALPASNEPAPSVATVTARELNVGDVFRYPPRERVVWRGEQSQPGSGRWVAAGFWPSPFLRIWRVAKSHGGLTLTVSTNGVTSPKKRRRVWFWGPEPMQRLEAQEHAGERIREAA